VNRGIQYGRDLWLSGITRVQHVVFISDVIRHTSAESSGTQLFELPRAYYTSEPFICLTMTTWTIR